MVTRSMLYGNLTPYRVDWLSNTKLHQFLLLHRILHLWSLISCELRLKRIHSDLRNMIWKVPAPGCNLSVHGCAYIELLIRAIVDTALLSFSRQDWRIFRSPVTPSKLVKIRYSNRKHRLAFTRAHNRFAKSSRCNCDIQLSASMRAITSGVTKWSAKWDSLMPIRYGSFRNYIYQTFKSYNKN